MSRFDKYNRYLLFAIGFIAIIGIISAFNTRDIDEVCATNNSFLYKANGIWNCFNTQYEDTVTPIMNSKQGINTLTFDEIEKTYYISHVTNVNLEQYFFIQNQISHGYKEETNISCHLHAYTLIKDTGNVTLELNYTWYNIGSTDFTTYLITKNINISTINRTNSIISFGQISGTGKTISSTFKGKITRKTNETATQPLYLDFFDCHYQKDSFGSNEEYIK